MFTLWGHVCSARNCKDREEVSDGVVCMVTGCDIETNNYVLRRRAALVRPELLAIPGPRTESKHGREQECRGGGRGLSRAGTCTISGNNTGVSPWCVAL